jgi:inhibitor of KinA sporulation pathway (predicted exonuclease)
MAITINEATAIKLLDGTVVNARPLKLSLLREFSKAFAKISEVADDNDKSLDLLLECVKIAFKQYDPTLLEKTQAELEDMLDIKLVYQIIEEASGATLGEGLF